MAEAQEDDATTAGSKWWRPYLAPLVFTSLFVGLFVSGFLVDVPPSEQVVGQAVSGSLACVTSAFLVTERGRRAARIGSARSKEPMTVGDQWRIFFGVLAAMTAMTVSDSLDLHRWSSMTIAFPACLGAVLAVTYARRRMPTSRAHKTD